MHTCTLKIFNFTQKLILLASFPIIFNGFMAKRFFRCIRFILLTNLTKLGRSLYPDALNYVWHACLYHEWNLRPFDVKQCNAN